MMITLIMMNDDVTNYDDDQLTVSSRGCYGSHPKAERAEEERDQKQGEEHQMDLHFDDDDEDDDEVWSQ